MLAQMFINMMECFSWLVFCSLPFKQTCHLGRLKVLPGPEPLRIVIFAFPLYVDKVPVIAFDVTFPAICRSLIRAF